jgi:hypothetical protein
MGLLEEQHLLALTFLFMAGGVAVVVAVQLGVLAPVVLVEAQAVLVKILPLMQLLTDQVDTRHLRLLRVLAVAVQPLLQMRLLVANGAVLRLGALMEVLMPEMVEDQFLVVVAVAVAVVLTHTTPIG